MIFTNVHNVYLFGVNEAGVILMLPLSVEIFTEMSS
jgi:hypothetical protein